MKTLKTWQFYAIFINYVKLPEGTCWLVGGISCLVQVGGEAATLSTQNIGCTDRFGDSGRDHLKLWFTMVFYTWHLVYLVDFTMIHDDFPSFTMFFCDSPYIVPMNKPLHCRQAELSGQDLRAARCHGRRWMAPETLTMKEMTGPSSDMGIWELFHAICRILKHLVQYIQ